MKKENQEKVVRSKNLKNKMIITFNKKIYKKKAIQSAINNFSHLATLKISDNKDYFVININKIDQEVRNIFKDEFCNFVLAEGVIG